MAPVQENGEITYGKAFYRQYISMAMCGILDAKSNGAEE